MNYDDVKESIKLHEGYRLMPYKCTEGHLTGGVGHKINDGEEVPTTKEGWLKLFDKDFETALNGANNIGIATIVATREAPTPNSTIITLFRVPTNRTVAIPTET
mgnify:CR=1 FL=1